MRLQFERKGGFAGIPLTATIEIDELPPGEGQRFRDMISAANFFSLPSLIAAPTPIPDRFRYTLTIETAEQRHMVSVDETATPPSLRALIQALTSAAQLRRRA
jgi:hypothetical protein